MKKCGVLPSTAWKEKILPLRQQSEIMTQWLRVRFDEVIPYLMEREQFDMWILLSREYNEDPVLRTMLPPNLINAWGRTILIFTRQADGTVKRNTLARVPKESWARVQSRDDMLEFFENVWDHAEEDEWTCLGRFVKQNDPKKIGLNFSYGHRHADGITSTEKEQVMNALEPEYAERVESAERMAVGWLETRTQPEIEAYEGIMQVAHGVIAEAFSPQVVHPGITTSVDVLWWMKQRIHDLGLFAWFQPSVSIHRDSRQQPSPLGEKVILAGDVLWCDVGLKYLGLCTDTQQNAYVLRRGETDAPEGIKAALADGNRIQDILAENFVAGLTGEQITERCVKQAEEEGIRASIYTHPIGTYGHGAGISIGGIGPKPKGTPRPRYELYDNTCFSYEFNVVKEVPEWDGQDLRIALEQDALFADGKVHFLGGRPKEYHLI